MNKNTINNKVEAVYQLTPLQLGMLHARMADENSTAYVIQSAVSLSGNISEIYVRGAMEIVFASYPSLRSTILYKKVSKPKQVIMQRREPEINFYDFSNRDADEMKKLISGIKEKDLKRNFDLERDTLIRMTIIKTAENESVLLFTAHHIIIDGWCNAIIINKFAQSYMALSNGSELGMLIDMAHSAALSYDPFKAARTWLNERNNDEAEAFWRDYLDNYENNASLPCILGKCVDASERQYCETLRNIDDSLTEKIRNVAAECGVTYSTIFETALAILLRGYNNTNDVVFGKVTSGRNMPVKGIKDAVGLFINTIAKRVRFSNNKSIDQLLRDVLIDSNRCSKYDYMPLSTVQTAHPLKNRLFSVLYVYENYFVDRAEQQRAMSDFNQSFEITAAESVSASEYGLMLSVAQEGDSYVVSLYFDTSVISECDADRYCRQYINTLKRICDDLQQSSGNVDILDPEERERVLYSFNNRVSEYNEDDTIISAFLRSAKKKPDKAAIVCDNGEIIYSELLDMAGRAAEHLRKIGVGKGDNVVVCGQKSFELIAAIFGIMMTGAAYVPLDATTPGNRIKYVVTDCAPKAVVCDDIEPFADSSVPLLNTRILKKQENNHCEITDNSSPDDIAYIIYTSGTTGDPKGVMVEHRNLICFREAFIKDYDIDENDRTLLFASIAFDASIGEIMIALLTGGTLCIPSRNEPDYINDFLVRHSVTVAPFPPQFAAYISYTDAKFIMTAGSEVTAAVVNKLVRQCDYINAYGPTEATICASFWKLKKGESVPDRIPIGVPQMNYRLCVFNGNTLCGLGMPGELCISGNGVTRGYLGKPELTAKSFTTNPITGERMYRTGDLACWRDDGCLYFMGRIDDQVKISGYRIEIGEIENALMRLPDIEDAAVLVKSTGGAKCLVAYIVCSVPMDVNEIKLELRKDLPRYMIPSFVQCVDKLPITQNGKVDKKALTHLKVDLYQNYIEPEGEDERTIADIFAAVLNVERVSAEDNFFEIGGSSILAMELINRMRASGYELSLGDIDRAQSPREIALKVQCGKTVARLPKTITMTQYQAALAKCPKREKTLVQMEVDYPISLATIKQAAELLLQSHPLLRYVVNNSVLQLSEEPLCGYCKECNTVNEAITAASDSILMFNAFIVKDITVLLSFDRIATDSISIWQLINEFARICNQINMGVSAMQGSVDIAYADRCVDSDCEASIKLYSAAACKRVKLGKSAEQRFRMNSEQQLMILSKAAECVAGNIIQLDSSRKPGEMGVMQPCRMINAANLDRTGETELAVHIFDCSDICTAALEGGMHITSVELVRTELFAPIEATAELVDSGVYLNISVSDEHTEEQCGKYADAISAALESIMADPEYDAATPITDDAVLLRQFVSEQFDRYEQEFARCSDQANYPAMEKQKLFFSSSQFAEICCCSIQINGAFSKELINSAVVEAVRKQSVLRSRFDPKEQLIFEKAESAVPDMPYIDLRYQGAQRAVELAGVLESYGRSLERLNESSPLSICCTVRLSANTYAIYLFSHHAVCDVESMNIWKAMITRQLSGAVLPQVKAFSNYVAEHSVQSVDADKADEIMDLFARVSFDFSKCGAIKADYLVSAVSVEPAMRLACMENPVGIAFQVLCAMLDSRFSKCEIIPFLLLHHGRTAENSELMGLFLNIIPMSAGRENYSTDIFKQQLERGLQLNELSYFNKLLSAKETNKALFTLPIINISYADVECHQVSGSVMRVDGSVYQTVPTSEYCGMYINVIICRNGVKFIVSCSAQDTDQSAARLNKALESIGRQTDATDIEVRK